MELHQKKPLTPLFIFDILCSDAKENQRRQSKRHELLQLAKWLQKLSPIVYLLTLHYITMAKLYMYWRNPTAYELMKGYGAIHTAQFKMSEAGLNKKGVIKEWFISEDDGLRYNKCK